MINLPLIFKRTRHEWRQLAVLLFSICLVAAFFALGPFYVRATTESGLRYELAHAKATDSQLTFINPAPFHADSWNFVAQQLGDLNGGLVRISRTAGAIRGFDYLYGEPTTEFTPRSAVNYHIFAFSNLHGILKLIDGRWPNRLPPPDSPERHATSPEDQIAKGLGIYSRGDVEAVLTPQVAAAMDMTLGSRFVVGELAQNRVVVVVVGIVEAVNPDDPIWSTNREALDGEQIDQGLGRTSFNMGLIVTEGAYTDWIAQATRSRNGDNNTFVWQIPLKLAAINADNFEDVQNRLSALTSRLTNTYRGLSTLSTLPQRLGGYTGRIDSTRGPVLLLSGAILILMLYHLVTTAGLVLQQQLGEWSSLASRGASTWQLVTMQAITVGLLCIVAFIIGPPLAFVLMQGLVRVGPLAATSGGNNLLAGIPPSAYPLSAIAVLAAAVVLTLPAYQTARRSLAEFKQITARPPLRPTWARYWLDIVLIMCGLGFVARLLFFVSGDLGQTLALLITDPRQLIQIVLDSANQTGGLSDPLNLLGPALLLTGLALFWLRLFPVVMRVIGALVSANNGLTGPLSVWNVERDPGHYAQLVLLLIGTLALGTAALSLGATRDAGAWSAARLATGGAVRVDFNPAQVQADQLNWHKLAGVTGGTVLTRTATEYKAGRIQIFLVGVNPTELQAAQPENANIVAPLVGQQSTVNPVPVVMSATMAAMQGQSIRDDKLPLVAGNTGKIDLPLPDGNITLTYKVVGITRDFPSLGANQHFMIMTTDALAKLVSTASPNQIWLETANHEPSPEVVGLGKQPGVAATTFAWDRYNTLLREPLPAAIAGILYAGFWVSLLLGLLDFGFYLAVTARRRSLGFAVLQALGWNINNIWQLLIAEQAALAIPALLVGLLLGTALAYVILPFLALAGGETLVLPLVGLAVLLLTLLIGFGLLLLGAAWWLRRLNVNQVLRLGEE
ncbi:MAG: ABC transporter permease [Chloroflexota bacterium]